MWHTGLSVVLGTILILTDFPLVTRDAVLPGPVWARLPVIYALAALQLLRDRRPVLALVLGLPLGGLDLAMGLSLPGALLLGDLVYSSVLHGSRRASRVILGVALGFMAVMALVSVVEGDTLRESLLIVLGLVPLPVIPVWWALNVRQQREVAEAERARADQLAHIAELDRVAAVHAERSSMARDLHDVIAGHVSAIAIQTEALLTMHPDADPERTRLVLRSVRDNSLASLHEMRAMIGLLRSDRPDGMMAPAGLRDLDRLVDSARAAGVHVEVNAVDVAELPAAVDLSAYRIVQEALTNALKHAPGAHVGVELRRSGEVLLIEVISDAPAGPPNPAGIGLIGMVERAEAIDGKLSAGPCPRGWCVRAELPLEEP